MTDAYIYDAVRTPRGKGRKDGSLHEVTSVALAATTLKEIRDRNNLDTSLVEDVIMGCVTAVGENGGNIGRNAVFAAEYAENVPGLQINRFCASGMEAVNMAANQVRGGAGDLYVAG
ncbi:MAG: acetyl-CoA C-acyltransferase, partial [Pseudomonadota bacterium]